MKSNPPAPKPEWSKPYHGITHLGTFAPSRGTRWATVTQIGASGRIFVLACHVPVMAEVRYDNRESDWRSIDAAKRAGETYVNLGTLPESLPAPAKVRAK